MRRSGKLRALAALVLALAMTLSCALAAPTIYATRRAWPRPAKTACGALPTPPALWSSPSSTSRCWTSPWAPPGAQGQQDGLIRQDGLYLLQPEYDTLEHLNYGLYLARRETSGAW